MIADRVQQREKRLFCDCLGGEKRLVICGGGHVSMPVIQLGAMMEFTVTVLEDRPLYANNARRAGAHQVICDSFENGLDQTKGSKDTYFIILTRGHRYDQICLERIAKMSPCLYRYDRQPQACGKSKRSFD